MTNTKGIDLHWKPGEDDRVLLGERCGLGRKTIDTVLSALQEVVSTRRRTKLVGFGVFEWMPWRNRIPTGRRVETWRLAFKPSRYSNKYNGDEK